MTTGGKLRSDARQRILETADRLFYTEGIRAVGIDRIIAQAGVAKMSLYKHFTSEDALILAVLEYREQQFTVALEENQRKHRKKGMAPLEAFFAAVKDWFNNPGFRGCMFINTRAEFADATHEGARFSAAHKRRFRSLLERVVTEEADAKVAKTVVPAILLLVEGAIVTAVMEQSSRPADQARAAALSLIELEKNRQ